MTEKPAAQSNARTYTSARTKLLVCASLGAAAGVAAGLAGTGREAPLIGWCVLAVAYCVWMWASIWPMDPAATAAHANAESPGRDATGVILVSASIASLLAVGFVLFDAGGQQGSAKYVQTALAVGSVVVSWVLVHTLFTVRYARLYYLPPAGGIDFNDDEPPQYSDFAYIAFTIGMTFQVSDTNVRSKAVRRAALQQALLSFPLGTVIIATTVNLVAGLANK